MRGLVAAAIAAGLLAAGPARAQVTVNPGALDILPSQPQTRPPQRQPPPQRPAAQPQQPARPAPPPPAPPVVRPAAPLTVPAAPPPAASMPPPVAVPTQRPAPPAPVVVSPDAPGQASAIPGGTRVTFGPDRSDLNPATEAALRTLARSVKGDEGTALNVLAYAAGGPEDPSTPRRVSLARALIARAVLIQEGIVSTRIYVRALGASGGDGPADRVDVTAAGAQPRAGSATQ